MLTFCAEPAAMPRTGKATDGSAQGLDVAVARLVCKKLGRTFEVHWCASPLCSRNCLREKRCDVILGHPLDEGAPKDIAWSVPYAGAQFGLVVSGDAQGIRSLADLIGKRVGIVGGTVGLPESKYTVLGFRTREQVLDRFMADKLAAAFVDADFAAWHLHAHPKLKLRLVEGFVPRERWNMAFATRPENAKLLVEINKALAELAESGDLKKAYAELGVPYRAPFTGSARRPAPVDTWKRIQDRGELRIALDPANLPYSSAKKERPGFDVELARDIAREIGLKLRIDWLDIQRETAIGKLLANECDFALGAAIDDNAVEDDDELADRVIYSRPYYGSGYVLVTRQKGPRVKSLAELKGDRSRRLGTEAGSVADYRLRQRGYLRSLYRNQLAVLKALDDGDIDYAYLWANVGWTLHTTPEFKLEIVPGYVPEDHWDIAVAMRKGDIELKRRVDAAIAKLVKDGTVARALARYHVPPYPAFDDKKEDKDGEKGAAETGVIRHPVADRGREPQMQKLQTSRNPYGGLERVRSAGVLVVGLDQGNLPFSAAHPEPAGLDYEIARLLADKLGVSLRVYWAYSAHDSYPSKLATKKLCDVMLGVMPDARFGDRVLYSKPYYLASYQLVVPAGARTPASLDQLGEEPLATEPEVAVRGLQGRATRTYPSLEAILEAVAAKKAKAGYVISARGHWLASRRWPDQLRFLDGDPADRFPICAAVRKSDRDLKAAIEKALDELAESGKLAAVFARWKIPSAAPFRGEKK
ncbi:MAG TPA: transporter substrate-binding domain-containing protein [Gemmataceae bacterium]|nr:transporter substrate-binding domain-containing protein [Gemmataceae bacterium]